MATLMLHHPESIAEEVGLCMVDQAALPPDWNIGALPPIGASPDGIIFFPRSKSGGKSGSVGKSGVRDVSDRPVESGGANTTTGDGASPSTSIQTGKGSEGGDVEEDVNDALDNLWDGGKEWERLVVEVKNSSPFRRAPDRPGRFVVFDRDPYDTPPAYHMPQLQMEMLAAGTQAGLLAMQSATRGVRVFRIERDDKYIRAMLALVSEFYVTYVLGGEEPPERMFAHRQDHREFVSATVRLARTAVIWEQIPTHHKLPGEVYDLRPFISTP